MSGFSTYTNNAILNNLFKGINLAPADTYMALFLSTAGLDNDDPDSWQEVTGTDYARVLIPTTAFSDPDGTTVTSTEDIFSPIAGSAWGTIVALALMDAEGTGTGNVLVWGELRDSETGAPLPRNMYAGDQLIIRSGNFIVTLLNTPD